MSGRALITGLKDNGKFGIAAMTSENHLEVAIHSPRLPFGSIHTERMTPIFQSDAVYGLNSGQVNLGDTGNLSFEFVDEITLQPGESLTVAAKSTTGTPSYVVAAINTREDQ